MSSLRNAVPRRTHAERAQPTARRKLGLLEKKADYKERAANFQKRSARLNALQNKAAERNPDEFYKAMAHQVAGRPLAREESTLSHATIVRLKDQDLRYAGMRKVVADRKVGKLRANLHGTLEPLQNEKLYWAAPPEELRPPPSTVKGVQKRLRRAYADLEAAQDHRQASTRTFEYLAAEKTAMTAKGRKRKVKAAEDGKPAVYKWKRQRKK